MSQSGGGGIGRLNSSTSETVRLSINVPLYQSGAEYSLIRQNKRSAQAAKYEMERTEDTTHDSATKAWKDLTTTRSTIKARQASVKAATVALDGVRQEQEIGSRTVLDVLDAEQELFEAKVNLVIAERNKVLATYNVLAAIGELTADSLQLPTEIYDPDVHFGKVKYQMFGF